MKRNLKKSISLLLTFAMVLGMLPGMAPHVHAAGTGEVVLIGPGGTAIAATVPPEDPLYNNENLLAFYLNTGGTYTLTTNGTSANAVSLMVNTTAPITVVLDNVSIAVEQPKRSSYYYQMLNDCTAKYNPSAIEIVQADSSQTVDVELKIKGVNNLKAAAKTVTDGYEPAVLQLTGVNAVISGYDSGDNVLNIRNGTVEGTPFSPNGIVATKDLTLGSGVTYNIGDYSNKDANLFIGNEGVRCSKNLVIADGAVVNIGIDNPKRQRADCLVGKKTIGAATVNLRATYGDAIRGDTVIGNGAVVTAVSDENSAVYMADKLVIGDGATVSLTSNSDNYGAVLLNSQGSFSVGENSTVTITSKASGNNGWAVARKDGSDVDVSVGSGSAVTVNSDYGGLYSNNLTLDKNAKLIVHADEYFGINETESITVGAGATLHVSSDESYGIHAQNSTGEIYLNSGNVLVRGKEAAFYINSKNEDFFVRGITSDAEITTWHSSDDKPWEEQGSVSWTAFTEGKTAARWFKTEAGSHVHVYTNGYEYEADKHHYGICACGTKSATAEECTYPDGHYNYYPKPTATKDGTRTWKCSVCKGYWYETIPAHNCADYVNKWEDYGSATQHKGVCTYLVEASGNTCGVEVYADHTFTDWSGDSQTISRRCTGCGRVESKNTHQNVTHMEAVPGDCSQPGRIEFWHCTDPDCGLYFADELMKQVVELEDTFTTPGAHSYGSDGVCTVCRDTKATVTFIKYADSSYSSDMVGELFILVGFKGGQAYAMGNETNKDGSREAVPVTVKANGAITTDSATAEFFALDWDEATLSPDGGYMSMMNGKIVVYDKARVDEDGLPKPMHFSQNSSYTDETGYLLNWTNYLYIVFDAETLTFKVSDTPEDSIVRYKQVCSHENLYYTPAAEDICTEHGAVEYWYCEDCHSFFMNGDFEKAVEIDSETELTKKATGHKFDDGICENCGMKQHVYTQVSTLEDFDALSEDASYIIVFKDGNKTYAAYYPDVNAFDQMVSADSDGDGVVDLLETDANANGIPDLIENYIDTKWDSVDYNEDGDKSAEEYNKAIGSYFEEDDVDVEDYKLFFSYDIEDWLFGEFWKENAINHSNIVEVIVAADGSITVTDEGAMEFQMMEAGVHGNQEYSKDAFEEYGIKGTERMRAAWIPNYWIGASGMMGSGSSGEGHFIRQERYYGDGEYPGIQDHKNWKISFREDGTACLVNTWEDFYDDGALQLAKYTDGDGNARMTIVGLPEGLWKESYIMQNKTALLPAYLYASEPVYDVSSHTCDFGDWVDDENGDTHTRTCKDPECGKTETAEHELDEGKVTREPTCVKPGEKTYSCLVEGCDAIVEEELPVVDPNAHKWGEWESTDNGHSRYCLNEGCQATETNPHAWVPGKGSDEGKHVCSVCGDAQSHAYDEGEVIQEPTCEEPGEIAYTCDTCGDTYFKTVTPVGHSWSEWETVKEPTATETGEEMRVCTRDQDQSHIETRPIAATGYCIHTCAACGGCTADPKCNDQDDCTCGGSKPLMTTQFHDGITILPVTQPAVTVEAQAVTVPVNQPDNPYVEYVLTNAEGYDVDTIYDISLINKADLPKGESAKVTLFVGKENAAAIAAGTMYLIHVTGADEVMYGLGRQPITVEQDAKGYTGYVTFYTDSFSPFALVSIPYYGRSALAAEEKSNSADLLGVYDALAEGIENVAKEIDIAGYNLSVDEFLKVYQVYLRDHSEHFWLDAMSYSTRDDKVVKAVPTYLMTGAALTEARAEFDAAVRQLLDGISGQMSEYERELIIHDRLAQQVTYKSTTNCHNAYGALVEGEAVCEGYAEALQFLLQRAGIQSFLVTGYSKKPGGGVAESHMWNLVRIDGKYYYVDATWDDQGENLFHAYFNQTTAIMKEDHDFGDAGVENPVALPNCTATDWNYFENSEILGNDYTVQQVANCLQAQNGYYSGSMYIAADGGSEEFSSWLTKNDCANILAISGIMEISGSLKFTTLSLGRETILKLSSPSGTPLTMKVTSAAEGSVTVRVKSSWPLDFICIAAYDNRNRMLAMETFEVGNGTNSLRTLTFSGNAHKVKAFLLNSGEFTPAFASVPNLIY